LVVLEPGLPTDSASGLFWAGIPSLAQGAGHFARQPEWDDSTMHPPLLEPNPRQLSSGVDLWAAHIRQATRWASLDNLHQTPGNVLYVNGLERQIRREQRHQGEPGQEAQQEIDAVMKLGRPQNRPGE